MRKNENNNNMSKSNTKEVIIEMQKKIKDKYFEVCDVAGLDDTKNSDELDNKLDVICDLYELYMTCDKTKTNDVRFTKITNIILFNCKFTAFQSQEQLLTHVKEYAHMKYFYNSVIKKSELDVDEKLSYIQDFNY